MVEWEGGVSDNSNVIPTLDSIWTGRARAVEHGRADVVAQDDFRTGAQGKSPESMEWKGKEKAEPGKEDGKKDTPKAAAPTSDGSIAKVKENAGPSEEDDEQGTPEASAQTKKLIQSAPGAMGIDNSYQLPGSIPRRGSAISDSAPTVPPADPLAGPKINQIEPETPSSEKHAADGSS